MAYLNYKKSKLDNSPIKNLNELNLIIEGNFGNKTKIIKQNSTTLSGKFNLNGDTIKLTYKGKFYYSTTAKFKKSSINKAYVYINNK